MCFNKSIYQSIILCKRDEKERKKKQNPLKYIIYNI